MQRQFIQNFEYINNKYFNSFTDNNYFTQSDNIEILELINSIDSIIFYLTETNQSNAHKKFQIDALNYLNRLYNILDQKTKNDSELNQTLLILHKEAVKSVNRYLDNTILNDDFKYGAFVSKFPENFLSNVSFLKENGYLEFSFKHSPEFLGWSDKQLSAAKETYKGESDWRGANAYMSDSAEYKFIKKFIQENEVLEIISEYKKMNMQIIYAAWDYSHHRQRWFRNNHESGNISPTNYYHFDANEDIAKMLIYLTDVSEDDGPFKFVKGSNTMPRSLFLTFIHYAIDSIISPKYLKEGNLYGRGLFLYRKDLLMKFPFCFMGTTHFGDDLIENSPLSNYLLDNTITFNRKKGAVILFDGFKGIHSGGNAIRGERLAVQVAFRRNKSTYTPWTLTQKVKYKIKSFLPK